MIKDVINFVMFWSFLLYLVVLSFILDIFDLLLFDFFDKVGLDKMNDLEGVGLFDEVVKMISIWIWLYFGEISVKLCF